MLLSPLGWLATVFSSPPDIAGWARTFFLRSRLNIFIFLCVVAFTFILMTGSAAIVVLLLRYWWLPANKVQLPIDFVYKTVKGPTSTVTRRDLVAMINLRDVASLVPMDYSIDLNLEMPKSEANRHMGNFAVRGFLSSTAWITDVNSGLGTSTQKTEKMCLFPFQSNLMRLFETVVFSPLYLFCLAKESSLLSVRLWESAKIPLKDHPRLLISLDKPIWITKATLTFTVHLRGLSWILQKYPLTTFFLGTVFVVEIELLSAALALIWYTLRRSSATDPYSDYLQLAPGVGHKNGGSIDQSSKTRRKHSMRNDHRAAQSEARQMAPSRWENSDFGAFPGQYQPNVYDESDLTHRTSTDQSRVKDANVTDDGLDRKSVQRHLKLEPNTTKSKGSRTLSNFEKNEFVHESLRENSDDLDKEERVLMRILSDDSSPQDRKSNKKTPQKKQRHRYSARS